MPELLERTLEILGARGSGKATLMGNLLFKCGGIDMLEMEHLQMAGIVSHDQVLGYLQRNGKAPSFYTRRSAAKFTSSGDADCALYLVDATSHTFSVNPHNTDFLRRAKSVVLLVNKMDEVEWSRESYLNTLKDALVALEGNGVDPKKVRPIPISALHGDNLIERSAKASWYEGWRFGDGVNSAAWTLLDAIDEA